jgi:Animal haem peroxidase
MSHHGMTTPRGMCKRGPGAPVDGRFGVLFPELPRMIVDPEQLREAGKIDGPMDEGVHGKMGSTDTPLGYVFLGQFIDHDITLDVTSSLNQLNDPMATRNFRTPTLDLDCIYGSGPDASRHLYYHAPPEGERTPRQEKIDGKHLLTLEDDFVRALSESEENPRRAALIGDFRNDENRILSQLQLSMHYFHNKVFDSLIGEVSKDDIFAEAQRMTRWHYQWVVVHDFLVRMVGQELVDDILCNGSKIFHCSSTPYIPIEFAVAAYRFGHTMVTMSLDYNSTHENVKLFGDELGKGFVVNTAGKTDWHRFFGPGAQPAGAVDIRLSKDLLALPFITDPGEEKSLATRNLLRGQSFGLPSGQSVHRAISEACGEDLPTPDLSGLGLPEHLVACTPLWLYILAEGTLSSGQRLGPVGGRIVAEVLIGLIESDPTSYLGTDRSWKPELAAGTWDMPALLAFADYGV